MCGGLRCRQGQCRPVPRACTRATSARRNRRGSWRTPPRLASSRLDASHTGGAEPRRSAEDPEGSRLVGRFQTALSIDAQTITRTTPDPTIPTVRNLPNRLNAKDGGRAQASLVQCADQDGQAGKQVLSKPVPGLRHPHAQGNSAVSRYLAELGSSTCQRDGFRSGRPPRIATSGDARLATWVMPCARCIS